MIMQAPVTKIYLQTFKKSVSIDTRVSKMIRVLACLT